MKKFLRVSAIVLLALLALILCAFATFSIITRNAVLDDKKLVKVDRTVIICDEKGENLTYASANGKQSVKLGDLNKETINAFIASEDRSFYSHNGLNFKRMAKALITNVASGSFKQGASTISQQLIKNTHLSNDKTITRKLNEIKLTKQLEKRYSKDEILEMYLNTIYFGHNCYGLQSAAQFYFGKNAEELTLAESATLAGLLSSPNNYSPFKNPEKSAQKRNIVLNCMKECAFIDENEYKSATGEPLNAKRGASRQLSGDYIDAVFDEIEELNINFYDLDSGCKIVTYIDAELQNFIENYGYNCDNSVIICDNSTHGVRAYKSTIGCAKRQPGSTIKPLACYAPAIEEKKITPATKISDEKTDFGGYSPENYDKKYHGFVSVADSLKYSYNIPAVKTLNSLTLKTAEKYLNSMGVELDEDEKNLSLALGGMKYGLSLKEIAEKYAIFANGGNFSPVKFVKEIISADGKVLYRAQDTEKKVFSAGTCSLINQMLLDTAQSGTAKKLNELPFPIAAKTGTCGNSEGNTDAYAVAYTADTTAAVWLGDKDFKRLNVTGGGEACEILKNTLNEIYKDGKPEKPDTESGIKSVNIDADDYYNGNKIILADDNSPLFAQIEIKILKDYDIKEKSDKFTHPKINEPKISVDENGVNIQLCHAKYYSYLINRAKNGKKEQIYDGEWKEFICDTPDSGYYVYSVIPYYKYKDKVYYGREILLPEVNFNASSSKSQIKVPDLIYKDWFDL